MHKPIESEWLDYREKVVSLEADSSQLIETRRAFYAGSASMLSFMCKVAANTDSPAAEESMAQLRAELSNVTADSLKW